MNETKAEKLQRLCGPRVAKVLNAMDEVARLGPLIKAAAEEGIDVQATVQGIQSAIAGKVAEMSRRLTAGEDLRIRGKSEHPKARTSPVGLARNTSTRVLGVRGVGKNKGKGRRKSKLRRRRIRAISAGLPSLGKKR